MPVIPIYQRRMSVPGGAQNAPTDVGNAGLPGRALAGLGAMIARRNEELRVQNNALAVLKVQNQIDEETWAFKQSYDLEANQSGLDPLRLQEFSKKKVDEFSNELETRHLSSITDADQLIHVSRYRNAAVASARAHAAVYQANARKDFIRVEATKAVDFALNSVRDGSTDYETAIEGFREKLSTLHTTGAVSAEDMEEMIVKGERQIVTAFLDGLIYRNPVKAREEIKSGKYSKYLSEDQFRYFNGKAEKLGEAEERENRQSTAYQELYAVTGADPDAMRKALMDPKIIKAFGLETSSVRAVEGMISDLEKTKKATYDQTETGYLQQLSAGKLKETQILADLYAGKIDVKGAEHWRKQIIEARDVKTDPVAAVLLLDKILRTQPGVAGGATAAEIMRAPGIAYKEKESLLSKFYEVQKGQTSEAERQAKAYVKSQLVSTGPLGNPLPAEHERLYKAYEAMDRYADAAKQSGKPWGIKEYMDYGKQLSDFYRPTIQTKVQDMNAAFKPAQERGVVPKAQSASRRNPGETVDQYLKRTGQE